jgi:uncharacterized protein Yka (UPF0111/DUF47 family)
VSGARWWHDHGLRRFLGEAAPDVVGLLVAQGQVSLAATGAFLEWSKGFGATSTLTAMEHDADEARRALLAALRGAVATPVDQEDLYILSERCDRVVNAVRRYRDAIAELYRGDDLQAAVTGRELYRPYSRVADLLEAVADRLWYVVLADA